MKALLLVVLLCTAGALAAPLQPRSAAEIVQRLDGDPASRARERGWQRRLQQQPRDEQAALALGQSLLARARAEGDARLGGRALAALQGFAEAAPPPEVALLRARVQQHLHDFEASAQGLQALLGRPALEARLRSQAALLLAGVRRTQGQLQASEAACAELPPGWLLQACALEVRGLREPARSLPEWAGLRAQVRGDASAQAWLWLAEAEQAQRAGLPGPAEAGLRTALLLQDDLYTRCALADLLQAQGRLREALTLLEGQARSDAVAVRQAALAQALGDARAGPWAAELRARFAQARERHAADPREPLPHLREQAQFALWVEQTPRQALALAQRNARQQRESADLLLLAQAAQAAGQPQALRQALQLSEQIGLRDERLQTLAL
ncbi:hypothetical protein [Inhella sp.]|uniref:hypothetical protein n=1 Tax=Inhella sp. TaxID=1921806 RepID=UPI0035AF82DE